MHTYKIHGAGQYADMLVTLTPGARRLSDLRFRKLAEALDAIARVACVPGEDMRFIRCGSKWYVYRSEDDADEDDTGAGALAVVERFDAKVTLSSASLATEDDFGAWVAYVGENLGGKLGLFVDVDAMKFCAEGPDVIHVEGVERSEVHEAISILREAFIHRLKQRRLSAWYA